MLQATPYVLHFKRILDFGEGQLYPTEPTGATALILKHLRFEGTQF